MSLSPMLSPNGKIIGDFTISNMGDEVWQLTASYGAQSYHMRWFEQHLPDDGSVHVDNVSLDWIGFQIAGPNARELLSRVTRIDVSNEAFPFMSIKETEVGVSDALIQRVSYTGDLGYEIYTHASQQLALYETLTAAGGDLGLKPFGMHAMMSLRLDKSFGSWLREYKPDYMPAETGLDRFTAYNKAADFIGKAAAVAEKTNGPVRRLCTMFVDASDSDVWGDEPVFNDDQVVGFVTSGGFSHYAQKSIAIGFLPTELINEGQTVEIEMLGERKSAVVYMKPLFDSDGARMRG